MFILSVEKQNVKHMEDWGFSTNSDINATLQSILNGKETHEEREAALIAFIRNYDKSANECFADLRTRAIVKNNVILIVSIISAILGALITLLFFL